MIEKIKICIGHGDEYAALLTDFSKSFDSLMIY